MRILYLDLDALTPSHLGCYGYGRNTSPTIDALAAQGLRLTNCYTSDAPCLPSRTAFYSGRLGIHTGVVGHGGTAAEPKRQGDCRSFRDWFDQFGLARQLQLAGYHTAMVSPFGQRHAAHWFYAGFNEIHNTGKGGMESAEEVSPIVLRWLREHAHDDQWYLHVNYWDIHTPYRAPADFGDPFRGQPLPDWITDDLLKRHIAKTGPHSAMDPGMYGDADPGQYPRTVRRIDSRANLEHWMNGYDAAILYVDRQIAAIVQCLRDASVYDDTLIIVSADHGENQGELGIYGEHGTADQATCNVPMIIRGPGVRPGVDHGLHYSLDAAPTLMDYLGRDKPAIWDGQSYIDLLRRGSPSAREQLVISQCCHVCQRSVRWDRWLYIRTWHDGFHLFPQEMLFDIASDPHELTDLAPRLPERCREGAWRLMQWHDAQMQKMTRNSSDVVDPMWTVMAEDGPFHANTGPHSPLGPNGLAKYIQRLEATGRADGAAALRQRYAIP